MSTLTRDLGFGAHVITVMAACFIGGVVTGADRSLPLSLPLSLTNTNASPCFFYVLFIYLLFFHCFCFLVCGDSFCFPLRRTQLHAQTQHSRVKTAMPTHSPRSLFTTKKNKINTRARAWKKPSPRGRSMAPDSHTVQVVLGMVGGFLALMVGR